MNIITINNIQYKYEFYWRDKEDELIYDSKNNLLPYPVHHDKSTWNEKHVFINTLKEAQRQFTARNKFKLLDATQYKDCLLCGKKHIITGIFTVNGLKWSTGMTHYINKHNIKPSDEFIDFIYRIVNNMHDRTKIIGKVKGFSVVKSEMKMLKLDRNQILIMDALMRHGGKRLYKDCHNN